MASSSVSQSAAIPPACLFAFQNQLLSKRFLILCTTWLPPPYSPAAFDPKLDEGGLQIFSERSEADSVYGKLSGRLLPDCNRWPCGQASGAKG